MTENIEDKKSLCKCGLATFDYADATDRVKFFVRDSYDHKSGASRSFSDHICDQIRKDIEDMKLHCKVDTGEALKILDRVQDILKANKEKPLSFSEYDQVQMAVDDLDGAVLPDFKKCAEY